MNTLYVLWLKSVWVHIFCVGPFDLARGARAPDPATGPPRPTLFFVLGKISLLRTLECREGVPCSGSIYERKNDNVHTLHSLHTHITLLAARWSRARGFTHTALHVKSAPLLQNRNTIRTPPAPCVST